MIIYYKGRKKPRLFDYLLTTSSAESGETVQFVISKWSTLVFFMI